MYIAPLRRWFQFRLIVFCSLNRLIPKRGQELFKKFSKDLDKTSGINNANGAVSRLRQKLVVLFLRYKHYKRQVGNLAFTAGTDLNIQENYIKMHLSCNRNRSPQRTD
jgi:hypothetical protein